MPKKIRKALQGWFFFSNQAPHLGQLPAKTGKTLSYSRWTKCDCVSTKNDYSNKKSLQNFMEISSICWVLLPKSTFKEGFGVKKQLNLLFGGAPRLKKLMNGWNF